MMKKLAFIIICTLNFLQSCYLSSEKSSKEVLSFEENPIQLAITSPIDKETINHSFTVKGFANSINPITEIKIFIDNGAYDVKIAPQWEGPFDTASDTIISLDPTLLSLGSHSITVTAKDSKGYTMSCSIIFYISNELSITILSHTDYQLVHNNLPITVTGSCNVFFKPLDKVEVWIDDESNKILATVNTDYIWSATISGTYLTIGQHIIYAKVYDSYQYIPNTLTANRIIRATDEVISARILYPDNGSSVTGLVNLRGSAYASKPPMTLDIQIDNSNWFSVTPSGIWNYQWDTSAYSIGSHLVSIRIKDSEERESFDSRIFKIEPVIIRFIQPLEGSSMKKKNFIAGSFSSSHPVKSVNLYLDNEPILDFNITPTTEANWSTVDSTCTNNVLEFPESIVRGYHTLKALATDIVGNIAKDEIVVDVKVCKNIAWIPGANDNIENLLYELQYTSFMTSVSSTILVSLSSLSQYCWLIKNCDVGMYIDYFQGIGSSTVVNNLRSFINNGNSFLCNHFDLDYVTNSFSEYMTFTSYSLGFYNGIVNILEYPLQEYLGGTNSITAIIGNYGLGSVNFNSFYSSKILVNAPITYSGPPAITPVNMVTVFEYGKGTVCYTGFHYYGAGVGTTQILKYIIESLM